MPVVLTPVDGSPSGTYYSWPGMKEILGQDNAEIVSQLDGSTTPDLGRAATDGETGDAYTNFRARNGTKQYATPIPDTSADFKLIQYATNLYASYLLARHRNWFNQSGDAKDKLVDLRSEAMELYLELFGPSQPGIDAPAEDDDTPPAGTFQNVDLVFETECTDTEFSG